MKPQHKLMVVLSLLIFIFVGSVVASAMIMQQATKPKSDNVVQQQEVQVESVQQRPADNETWTLQGAGAAEICVRNIRYVIARAWNGGVSIIPSIDTHTC